jgi:hypothetical protein
MAPGASKTSEVAKSPDARSGPFMFLLTPAPSSAQTLSESPFLKRARSFRKCHMYRPPPRDRLAVAHKKVLLIDRCQATREVRAAVLRTHAVEVHEAEEISAARFLWRPRVYDLLLLAVRRYSSEEARKFYEQIRDANPGQRFIFLLGPPRYVSSTWPGELADDDVSRGQWGETVKRFLAAA